MGLTILLYSCHLFPFVVFVIILVVNEVYFYVRNKSIPFPQIKRLSIVLLPVILLFIIFIISNNQFEHKPPKYIEKIELWHQLCRLQPLITMNVENETPYVNVYFYCILFLFLSSIVYIVLKKQLVGKHLPWLVSSLLILGVFFFSPDWVSSGGLISIRWLLFFYLLSVIWIALVPFNPNIKFLTASIMLITSFFFSSDKINDGSAPVYEP